MSLRRFAAPFALAATRLYRRVAGWPDGAFRILLFHDVPAADRDAFARLVADLAAAGRLIGPAEAEAMLAGRMQRPGAPPFLISFDDGFASNAEVADSILAPHGVKALFFLCPGLMDELGDGDQRPGIAATVFAGRRDPASLPPGLRLMDWQQARALREAGHALGSHTLHHRRLAGLDGATLEAEIGGAARRMAEMTGQAPDWFAFPFGDIDSIDAAALAVVARHHRFCRAGVRGLNRAGTGAMAVRADQLDLDALPAWRQLVLEGGLDLLYAGRARKLDAAASGG